MRVMLVEDHEIIRAGLKTLLEMEGWIQVIATESSAMAALAKLDKMSVDVVLVDVSLPDEDGIWLTREIKARHPYLPVLILTMHTDSQIVTNVSDVSVSRFFLDSRKDFSWP